MADQNSVMFGWIWEEVNFWASRNWASLSGRL